MSLNSDHFPVLNIQEFSLHPSNGYELLFHELKGRNSITKPHKHDFFIIIYFEKGKGEHWIDFKKYQIANRQVHLVFPNQVHQWEIEDDTLGYQLMMSRNWFQKFWPSLNYSSIYYQNHPVFEVPNEISDKLLYEFKAIKSELADPNDIFWELVQTRNKIIELLVSKAMERGFEDVEKFHSNNFVANFLDLVEANYKTERSVSFYADQLNISANYLNVVCQKNIGTTASSIIKDRVLLEAKRLLKGSEMSLKDIIYDLNFYDHANFTKFFKMLTGLTPSQFKEEDNRVV